MAFKQQLTPLDDLVLLDDDDKDRLRRMNVTTVEELIGLLQADPDAAAQLLHRDSLQVARLRRRALGLLPEQVRVALELSDDRDYPLGALDPRSH